MVQLLAYIMLHIEYLIIMVKDTSQRRPPATGYLHFNRHVSRPARWTNRSDGTVITIVVARSIAMCTCMMEGITALNSVAHLSRKVHIFAAKLYGTKRAALNGSHCGFGFI